MNFECRKWGFFEKSGKKVRTREGGREQQNVEYRIMNNEGKRQKAQICLAAVLWTPYGESTLAAAKPRFGEAGEVAEKFNHELRRIY